MINPDRLLETFLGLVRIDSPTGQESEIGRLLQAKMHSLGLDPHMDGIGNVIGRLDGSSEPLLLSAHMDTVQPGVGVKPVVAEGVVRSDGKTILGGDDKSGIAMILEVVESLRESGGVHRPLEIAFSVQEEGGLRGARALDLSQLRARQGLVLDSGGPLDLVIIQAPAQDRIQLVFKGKAAHAGAAPEKGINAIVVASRAIAAMPLGRIDVETTANVGVIQGGLATNIVPDRVEVRAEARSLKSSKLARQTKAMVQAANKAASEAGAGVEVTVTRSYDAWRLPKAHPWPRKLAEIFRQQGLKARFVASGGGSDANVFNAAGMECLLISTGMDKAHTTEEQIAVVDLVAAARLLEAIVTA